MRRLLLLAVGTLVLAPAAPAGGWATAGLGPPDGLGAGETWNAELTLLQHGVTPLDGVQPAVIISNGSGKELRFAAAPTGKPGVYVAKVTFPEEGTWRYRVDDGFSQVHNFAPVQIGAGDGGGFAVPSWSWGIALAALGLLVLSLLARRLRPASAPVAQP